MLERLLAILRAPIDFIRTKIFGVSSAKGKLLGDVNRIKQLPSQYKAAAGEVKQMGGQAQAAAGKVPKKKMGLFSKKKKCMNCNQKLHASWDQCPYCGTAVNAAPVMAQPQQPVMAAPMPSAGGKMKTMAIDVGGANVMVSGQAGSGWLVPLDGPQTGELFQLKGRAVVGTAPDCDVVMKEQSISGRHAEFMATSQGFRVNDLGSTNGTYVNDKRVTNSDLIDNDNIRLGRVNFKFKSMS